MFGAYYGDIRFNTSGNIDAKITARSGIVATEKAKIHAFRIEDKDTSMSLKVYFNGPGSIKIQTPTAVF